MWCEVCLDLIVDPVECTEEECGATVCRACCDGKRGANDNDDIRNRRREQGIEVNGLAVICAKYLVGKVCAARTGVF